MRTERQVIKIVEARFCRSNVDSFDQVFSRDVGNLFTLESEIPQIRFFEILTNKAEDFLSECIEGLNTQ
jgi:hypothetical protein